MAYTYGKVEGILNSVDDQDWFRIDLAANTHYQISGSYGILTVYDARGTSTGVSRSYFGWNAPIDFIPLTSDTYYVSVAAGDSWDEFIPSIPYALSIVSVRDEYSVPIPDDYSNKPNTSGTLAVGGTTFGNIEASGDHDWFRVTLDANTFYQFATTLPSEASCMNSSVVHTRPGLLVGRLAVYDASGGLISSPGDYSFFGFGENILGFTPPSTGTYFVDVSFYDRYVGGDGTGPYSLSLIEIGDDYCNNTCTTGRLAVGGSTTGIINAPGDHDWFKVTLKAGRLYDVSLDVISSGRSYGAWVYISDASGSYISEAQGFMPETTGVYYIGVTLYDTIGWLGYSANHSLSYALSLSAVADDYRDNASTTGTIDIGGSVTGTLNTGDDHDWFRISLAANTLYQVSVQHEYFQYECFWLSMYDVSGATVANSFQSSFYPSSFTFMPATSETYFVDVTGLGNPGSETYALSLAIVDDDYFDNTNTSGNLTVGGSVSGYIDAMGDHDWFRVVLSANTLYRVTDSARSHTLSILDANGHAIAPDPVTHHGPLLGFTPADSGIYYIDVSGNSQWDEYPNPYTLTLETVTDDFLNNIGTTGVFDFDGTPGINVDGTDGNDVLYGTSGNDVYYGLSGIDTATYYYAWEICNVEQSGSGYVISGPDGIDSLISVERLGFSYKHFAIDLTPTGNAGQALEFIGMLDHSSISNPMVITDVLRYFDNGSSMVEVCQQAVDIGLIDQLAGSSSDLDLARLVYRNVVGSEAEDATAQALAGLLETSGGTYNRAKFLATVATLEINQTHIDLVGLQQTGVEYYF